MSREAENAVLLLVGMSIGIISVTGVYSRYVKPGLLPWLLAAAILIVVLAVVAIVRDVRHGSAFHGSADHPHRSAVAWLLLVPIVILIFIAPPAIGPRGAEPRMVVVSADVLNHPFPPLPAGRAPTVSLPDVLDRVATDTAGTLDNRLITVVGFTLKEAYYTDLGRVVIICCAADARLARVHLGGPAYAEASKLPDEAWVSVEGIVNSGQAGPTGQGFGIPTLEVSRVTPIDPPANPYAR